MLRPADGMQIAKAPSNDRTEGKQEACIALAFCQFE